MHKNAHLASIVLVNHPPRQKRKVARKICHPKKEIRVSYTEHRNFESLGKRSTETRPTRRQEVQGHPPPAGRTDIGQVGLSASPPRIEIACRKRDKEMERRRGKPGMAGEGEAGHDTPRKSTSAVEEKRIHPSARPESESALEEKSSTAGGRIHPATAHPLAHTLRAPPENKERKKERRSRADRSTRLAFRAPQEDKRKRGGTKKKQSWRGDSVDPFSLRTSAPTSPAFLSRRGEKVRRGLRIHPPALRASHVSHSVLHMKVTCGEGACIRPRLAHPRNAQFVPRTTTAARHGWHDARDDDPCMQRRIHARHREPRAPALHRYKAEQTPRREKAKNKTIRQKKRKENKMKPKKLTPPSKGVLPRTVVCLLLLPLEIVTLPPFLPHPHLREIPPCRWWKRTVRAKQLCGLLVTGGAAK
ncbi:hypothetical protein DFH08DRAFT_821097 [Mycena albidolilacea]|uniref:Uncharacterized protein n=1 Tax=Mycena albidolilacea TaxID=1033008 RepID=A0AAD6ZBY1_9AGAR|nr:hypothetical protein DFH08DRAFT_821097 [Mycena albidolilacea]